MLIFVIAATALFGPIAAFLVELFPTRIRYTAPRCPITSDRLGRRLRALHRLRHRGAVGNIYSGLWYPFAFSGLVVTASSRAGD